MFKTRLEMAKHYDDLMNRTNESRREVRRQRSDENLIKTYILELHNRERQLVSREQVLQAVQSLAVACEAGLVSTDEWFFYGLQKGQLQFYVEATDPRFLLVHTHERADAADDFVETAITGYHGLDQAWLPSAFLMGLGRLGTLRGFKLRHDDALSIERRSPERESLLRRLALSVSLSEDVAETLDDLSKVRAFRHALNLTGVEIRVGESMGRRYALDEVYNDGKITARGTSFTAHHDLAVDLCDRYSKRIRQVEDERSVAVRVSEQSVRVEGLPFEVEIDPPLDNLDSFCRNLLSGSKPFRFWGVPQKLAPDYVAVRAVDLHGGHQLFLEISPDFMRVYLPSGACGNTIFRLFTSLQQHLARTLHITHGGGDFDLGIGNN